MARAIAGDKRDNLPGVPGAGLPTVAKRFPYLAEEKDYTTNDLVSTCLHEERPLKVHERIIENEKLIKDNYKIMQLYNQIRNPDADVDQFGIAGVDEDNAAVRQMIKKGFTMEEIMKEMEARV